MNFVQVSIRFLLILAIAFLTIILSNKAGIHMNNFYLRLVMIVGIVLSTKYSPSSALVLSLVFISTQIQLTKEQYDIADSKNQKY